MCEDYVIDVGRKITGVISYSHSFCSMEDTWLEHLTLSKRRDPLRSRIYKRGEPR